MEKLHIVETAEAQQLLFEPKTLLFESWLYLDLICIFVIEGVIMRMMW